MRLIDFFKEDERKQFNELQAELLDARNQKERIMIQAEIDALIETARARYNEYIGAQNEQSTTLEPTYA